MAPRTQRVAIKDLDLRFKSLRLRRPAAMEALRRSLEREGLLHAVVVNRRADGTMELLDGFKRLELLAESGQEKVEARLVAVDEVGAHGAMLSYNTAQGGLSELEEGWIVRSLVRAQRLSQKRVAELVGRHRSWVCRRLRLVEGLSKEVQEDMRLGLVGYAVARELGRLPRGNQAEVAEAVHGHALTSRQSTALVELWLGCQQEGQRRELVADPLRFVHRDEPVVLDAGGQPRLSGKAERLRVGLLGLEHSVGAVCHALGQSPAHLLRPSDLAPLAKVAAAVVGRLDELGGRLRMVCQAAEESGDA